jgi:hypothetical protein
MAFVAKQKKEKKDEIKFHAMTGKSPDGKEWTISRDQNTPRITLKCEGKLIMSHITAAPGLGVAKDKGVIWDTND